MRRETVTLPSGPVELLVPLDPEALLDERALGDAEFIPYWAELWPSALALAAEVATRTVELSGTRVLELGCGVGLVAISLARAGAHVHATDWSADAVALTLDNAMRNDVALEGAVADWFRADSMPAGPFDLVVAADVLYERRNVAPLAALLPELAPRAWVADPGRAFTPEFLDAVAGRASRHDVGLGGTVSFYDLRF